MNILEYDYYYNGGGVAAADLNNDGWKDIFVSNGIPRDITNNDFISYKADPIQHTPYSTTLMKELLSTVEELKPIEKSYNLFK